jgi:hypothetical protein
MALPKKHSRLITVDGVPYRWRVRHRPTYCQGQGWPPLTFAAEHAGLRGRVLVAELPGANHPANWLGLPGSVVTPSAAATIIQTALSHGWHPAENGTPFTLTLPAAELPLIAAA